MRITSFGFSRITTEQLEKAASSQYHGFYCGRAEIQCDNCPFFCVAQECADIDINKQISNLARAELKRRKEL